MQLDFQQEVGCDYDKPQYVLYTSDGRELNFYIENLALLYQRIYGGTIMNKHPVYHFPLST